MESLPQPVRDTLLFLYGPDKWWRIWAMLMTACVIFLIPKGTRRAAGIAFVALFCCAHIWQYLQTAYKQFTPEPYAAPAKKKKYL
ncbi:MAG: hypothetical protein SFU56_15070 [Capsulimonadales bacterium]|nr:hypothetical protein [Capsulimonadales bacterium]